jgi:hypothetical protein
MMFSGTWNFTSTHDVLRDLELHLEGVDILQRQDRLLGFHLGEVLHVALGDAPVEGRA